MNRPALCLIAAVARNGAIGKNNQLLVHLPGDLPRFKKLTLGCPVIMGRKTWDSIGRPLPQRRNIVITRNAAWQAEGAEAAASLAAALASVAGEAKAFVIGGAQIYAQALPLADELALTEIDADFDGDAFFPSWDRTRFEQTTSEDRSTPEGLHYTFTHYNRTRGD
jgi:dihydrofolate reductase